MSASITLHGPFEATARLIQPGAYVKEPFVSVDISTKGASVTLIAVDAAGLEALSAALGEARVLLASIQPACSSCGARSDEDHRDWCGTDLDLRIIPCPTCSVPMRVRTGCLGCASADDPPEYDPDDAEAQRIAEVPAAARAEQDRGL